MKDFSSVMVSFCADTDEKSSDLCVLLQQRCRFLCRSGFLDVRSVQSFLFNLCLHGVFFNLPDERYGRKPQLSEYFTVRSLCCGKCAIHPRLLPPG